nr:sulfatase [Robiginitalea sp. SC105]
MTCLNSCSRGDSTRISIPSRPNVLFILVDDLGYSDLGVYGSSFYETPNTDRLAASGSLFTQGYATSRVCSPSRASLLTGRFTTRHGITDWIGAASGENWREVGRHSRVLPAAYAEALPKADTTLAEAFREAGYRTFFAGKWHLGGAGSLPTDHGFDVNVGGWEKGSPMGGYFSPWENPFLPNTRPGENLPIRLARETSSFIASSRDTPFLAYLSFYAVHGPIQTTRERWHKFRDKADSMGIAASGFRMGRYLPIRQVQDNPVYAGLVENMDEAVGLVLDTLDSLGLARNTIVVFTSDNGGVVAGDSYSTSLHPLRGGKGYPFEGGIRVPLILRVPWLDAMPATHTQPVTGADLYPTLLELAGLPKKPLQHLDGKSLAPLLEGAGSSDWDQRPLIWHYPHYGNQGGEPSSVIRQGPWKLIHYYEDGRDELYNLETDLAESRDLAGTHPGKAAELYGMLSNFLSATHAKYPRMDPQYNALREAAYLREVVRRELPAREAGRMRLLSEDFDPGNNWWGSDTPE